METMKFHWEDNKGNVGSFTVTAMTVEECIEIAKEEIRDAELIDYYSF